MQQTERLLVFDQQEWVMGYDMSEPTPRFWQIFFEVFETIPRQGPVDRACTAEALALCHDLPASPAVIDLGCGVGG